MTILTLEAATLQCGESDLGGCNDIASSKTAVMKVTRVTVTTLDVAIGPIHCRVVKM